MGNTFKKHERLNSKIQINDLFSRGESFFKYPFKVVYLEKDVADGEFNAILISVSKRNFKSAVDRNRIKRLVREAYRLNKSILSQEVSKDNKFRNFALIYTAKSILPYKEIERKIMLILQTIKKQDEISAN